MSKPLSIRTRVLLWFMSALFFILLASSLSFYFFMHNFLYTNAEKQIRDKNFAVGGWIDFQNKDIDAQINDYIGSQEANIFVQITDLKGNLIGKTNDLTEKLPLPDSLAQTVYKMDDVIISHYKSPKYGDMLIANGTAVNNGQIIGFVQVGIQDIEITKILNRVIIWIAISIPLLLILSLLIGRLLTKKLIAPFALITQSAKTISADEISEKRLPIINPADELGKLTITINDLLDRLDAAISSQQQFVSNAAHELRTPLAIMQTEIEVALKSAEKKDEYKEILESNLEEVQRLSHLSEHLLALTRLDANSETIAKEKFDITELSLTVVDRFSKLLSDKQISCLIKNEKPVFIDANKLYMEHILSNLIDNSIKYSTNKTQINIDVHQDSSRTIISISDEGNGIPKEDIPFIFNRFYRVDKSRTGKTRGSGLGLSIVKSIIDMHAGDIKVESELGKGTSIKIILPNISI